VKTTVRWELQAVNEGTLVRHEHSGLAAHPEMVQSFRGWQRILGWLQMFANENFFHIAQRFAAMNLVVLIGDCPSVELMNG
jgi:hypothetical protein